jgi:hypothetical protein
MHPCQNLLPNLPSCPPPLTVAVDTEHGVVKGTDYVAKEGDQVVVHYTEDGGKKVVRFFKGA